MPKPIEDDQLTFKPLPETIEVNQATPLAWKPNRSGQNNH
jgi:hypothetical protein